MSPDEAADLAARTLAALDDIGPCDCDRCDLDVDRERVASDLAGLRDHREHGFRNGKCARCQGTFAWPCHDHDRYADGLRRTAELYGVTQ